MEKLKEKVFFILVLIVSMSLIAGLAYVLWTVGKRVNYHLQYKDMVEQTVRDTVKKECLK